MTTQATQALYATLCCNRCGIETTHVVLYVGPYLRAITCATCQRTLEVSPSRLRHEYMHDLPRRARDLAWRTMVSARQHPRDFISHLPRSLVLKPLAISSELYGILAESH